MVHLIHNLHNSRDPHQFFSLEVVEHKVVSDFQVQLGLPSVQQWHMRFNKEVWMDGNLENLQHSIQQRAKFPSRTGQTR